MSRIDEAAEATAAPEAQTTQTKFDDARALRDSLRFNELRQIPSRERSHEQDKEYMRLYQKNRRKALQEGVKPVQISKQVLARLNNVEDFWAHNKSMTDGKVIHRYLEMQERYLDEMYWLNHGFETPPDDKDFVSLEDGIACMGEFIAERGMIHDDSFTSPFLQSWKPFWGIWQDKKDYTDAIWGRVSPFWLDQERFNELCKESEATKIYARYGIRTALPQYHVRLWKGRIGAHANRHVSQKSPDEKCWLCNFERLHGETQQ